MTKKNTKESFDSQFKDKIIVITGSTQGSGAETAKLSNARCQGYYNLWKK